MSSRNSRATKATAASKVGAPDPTDEQPTNTGDKQISERPIGDKSVSELAQGASIVDSAPTDPADDKGQSLREQEKENRGTLDLAAEARKAQERGPLAFGEGKPVEDKDLANLSYEDLTDPRLDRTAEQGTDAEANNKGAQDMDGLPAHLVSEQMKARIVRPDSVGIRPDVAPLDAPTAAPRVAEGEGSTVASTAAPAVAFILSSGLTRVYDAATGEIPDTDDLFVEQGTGLLCTKRLVEDVFFGPHSSPSTRLVMFVGQPCSRAQGEAIKARIAAQDKG